MNKYYLAIDIGASSGRHIVGWRENGEIRTEEVYRFPNGNVEVDGHLTWDIDSLYDNVLEGIKIAKGRYDIHSLSIDTWGVDYVLMRGDEVVKPCYAYRDNRTDNVIDKVHSLVSFEELYAKTGIQFQPFNTIYQLYDDMERGRLEGVTDFLMMPEYLSYRLTGTKVKEYTNATTTGLVNATSKEYDMNIIGKLGLPRDIFGQLSHPGSSVGYLREDIVKQVGGQIEVVLCASHDTASAVEGIPMDIDSPYISSGTWSLLGVKSRGAITDEKSCIANWSNEGGVGYIRYQKNIMGFWVVQSLRRELCPYKEFNTIEIEARNSSFDGYVDINDNVFLAPESMKGAFDEQFKNETNKPQTESDYFRCAFNSLAVSYREAIVELEVNTGIKVDTLYIVGGGAKNNLLNTLTAKACGITVKAMPIEATAIGNLKIQIERCENE